MPGEIISVGLPDGPGRRRPGGSGSQQRRISNHRAQCGDLNMSDGVALDRKMQKRTARVDGGRRVRFAATTAGGEGNEATILLRGAAIDVGDIAPEDLTAATEDGRRVAVLESLQALERAQYDGHHKRVEMTTQVELERFWAPEATPQLIDEPVPLAL